MKTKLLYFLLAILLLVNLAMLFMLVKKPHKKHGNPHKYIIKQLNFSEEQKNNFELLKDTHHFKMRGFDDEIKYSKKLLFESYDKKNVNTDSLINLIGALTIKKEQELFSFFSKIRKICTEEQQKDFDKLIKRALYKKPPPKK